MFQLQCQCTKVSNNTAWGRIFSIKKLFGGEDILQPGSKGLLQSYIKKITEPLAQHKHCTVQKNS